MLTLFKRVYLKFLRYKLSKLGLNVVGDPKNLKFHNTATFGGNVTIFCNEEVFIGENTMVGYGTIIHTSTHDPNVYPMNKVRIDKPISIANNVWIGTGVIILPGVQIGSNSIVAAGSLVNKNVKENIIVAGIPAKHISSKSINKEEHKYSKITKEGYTTKNVNNHEDNF